MDAPCTPGARGHRRLAALLALLAAVLAPAAGAGGLSVAPISLQFAAREPVQGLWLGNHGGRALRAQLRVYAWTQREGQDRLEPSTDLVISPPMLEVGPDQRQFVRVVRRPGVATPGTEQAWRLLIDELPQTGTEARPGLNFVMRYSVPVFAGGETGAAPAAPRWQVRARADGSLALLTYNDGARRRQFSALELRDGAGRVLLAEPGLLGYVLAGSHREWPLRIDATLAAQAREIGIRIDGDVIVQPWPATVVAPLAR